MNKIITLSEYQNLLEKPGKHIIKVSASWCNPCKVLAKTIDTLDENVRNLFVEVDVEEAEGKLVDKLMIRNVPVLIFYDQDREFNRTVGAVTKDKILQTLNM